MKCLLCESEKLIIDEAINKTDYIRLWYNLNIDVKEDIKTYRINKYLCTKCDLSFFDTENAGGDSFYSKLGELDWYYLHSGKTEYDFVQKFISDEIKILDIGSGRGELFNRIKNKVDYTGLELSSKAVQLAELDGVNVINEDLYIHAEKNIEKYDLICLFQVLEHLKDPIDFIGEAKKCLKPGGKLIIAVPNNDSFIKYAVNNPLNLPPHHTIHWNESSLKCLAQKLNFSVVDVACESLQEVHKDWYGKTQLLNKWMRFFHYKPKSIDFSFRFRLIRKLASFFNLNNNEYNNANGHSIIIVLEK